MAMYDDDNFGGIFPTRTGTPTGSANERKMLDSIGGSDGFRTQQKTNSDGSVTMLRTRDGMPEFSRTPIAAGGGKKLNFRCRMMSDLYPRGADVLLVNGLYTTTTGTYDDWPDYAGISSGTLAPNTSYKGVRATEEYLDSPAPNTWYDTRPPATRQFDFMLSWQSILQPIGGDRTAPELNSYYLGLLGPTAYELGRYMPGNATGGSPNRFTQYGVGASNVLTQDAQELNGAIKPNFVAAACAVIESGVFKYRILSTTGVYGISLPSLSVIDYDENGNFLSSTSTITYPSDIGTAIVMGSFDWNQSGTQACVLISDKYRRFGERILLISSDGACSWAALPFSNWQEATQAYTSFTGGYLRTLMYDSIYYNISLVGYNGDELQYVVTNGRCETYGDHYYYFPGGYDYSLTVEYHTYRNTLKYETMSLYPSGTVLADNGSYDFTQIVYTIYELISGLWTQKGVITADSSLSGSWTGSYPLYADFRQQAFIVKQTTSSVSTIAVTVDIFIDGIKKHLVSISSGNGYKYQYKYIIATDILNTSYEVIPPLAGLFLGNHYASFNIQSIAAAVDKSGSVAVVSILYYTGKLFRNADDHPGLSEFKSKNISAFKVGSGWDIYDIALPTYSGTVKWLNDPLITTF